MTDELEKPEVEQPEPSLRDTIKASIAEASSTETPEAPAKPEAETPAQIEARARDERGKFAKAEEGKKRDTLTLPKKDGEAAPADKTPSPIKAPEGWSGSAKAKFAALDPEVQAEVVRRETDMHRKFTSQDEDRTLGKQLREAGRPYEATMAMVGADHIKAYQNYLTTAHTLMTGSAEMKTQALRAIAQQYNVNLGTPLQQAPQTQAPAQQPADVQRIVQAELQQQRSWEEHRRSMAEVEAFKAKPGHDHFDELQSVIRGLLLSGRFDSVSDPLQEAYDAALRADPELSSGYLAQKVREAEEQKAAALRGKTDAAKRAAVSVTGAPGGVKPNGNAATSNQSLRDTIKASLYEATGRV